MKTLDLSSVKNAGIHALKTAEAVKKLLAACEKTSLRYYLVDLAGIRNKTQLLATLSEALAFPDYFGRNWDALYDILCDEDWFGDTGVILHFKNTAAFEKQAADDWLVLRETLEEAIDFWRAAEKPLWVFIDHTRNDHAR